MPQKVIIHVIKKRTTTGEGVNCVEKIKIEGENVDFAFPNKFQTEANHKELFQHPVVKNAVKGITKVGHYRNLKVTLSDELAKEYLDEDCNFVFKDEYLEECEMSQKSINSESGSMNSVTLAEMLEMAKDHEFSKNSVLKDVERAFSIDKFNGKQKAVDWLGEFEAECERFRITTDQQKIKCLKIFLNNSAEDWYCSTAMKLGDDDWSKWSDSFITVFSDKGWSKIRYAYAFKYVTGSLVDYGLRKERLLLEVERKMTETSRLNLIVVGLPINIQDKLDQGQINSTEQLMNELRRYEHVMNKRSTQESYIKPPSDWKVHCKEAIEKKPCHICEALGFPERYHTPQKCRNRDRHVQKLKVNLSEAVNEEMAKLELDEEKN